MRLRQWKMDEKNRPELFRPVTNLRLEVGLFGWDHNWLVCIGADFVIAECLEFLEQFNFKLFWRKLADDFALAHE